MTSKVMSKGNIADYQALIASKLEQLDQWNGRAAEQEKAGQAILEEIEDDDNLEKFRTEYTKLLKVIKRSSKNALKLKTKSDDVIKEITIVEQQAVDSSKLGQDAQTLKTLKNQIIRAESLLESSNKREELARMEIRQLRQDIANLNSTIKQGVGLSAAQERVINDLIAAKEQYTKDLENELERIVSLRNGLTTVSERIDTAEVERKNIDKEIYLLKDKNTQKKLEIDMEMKNKERMERDLRELRVVVTIKSQEAISKQTAVNRATEEIANIENQIKTQKNMIEKLIRDQESLGSRTVKLQQDYDEQMILTKELLAENEITNAELKIKERELHNHKSEVKKVVRIKEGLVKKIRNLEEQKMQAEIERKVHRTKNDQLVAKIEALKRQVDGIKKNIDDLSREKDILESSLKKTQSETVKIESMLQLQRQQKATIELENARILKDIAENKKLQKQLTDERDAYIAEANKYSNQAIAIIADMKEKEMKIFDYKRQTFQAENKLKYQQNLYEAIQSDRKLHSKQLIESQTEINEMKRRLKIMNFQINGFKEDVNSKEAMLVKENADFVKLTKDAELIGEEIKTLKGQNELAMAYIKSQMVEEFKLDQFVKEADVERTRQQTALNLIVAERDNLSSQLLRRNQELTEVYDQMKTQSLNLLRGEIQYNEKMKEIRNLRKDIVANKILVADMSDETAAIPQMKRQIIQLQNAIIAEQKKIKALEEELENPINVHRWRKLEGSQPQAYNLILLQHTLQKKLIAKNKELAEKDHAIEVKEKLYLHLKTILAKQAGPEAVQQYAEFMKILKDKKKQLRHMDTELNMYKSQVKEYQYTIGQLDAELLECKKQFLKMYKERVEEMRNHTERKDLPPLPSVPFGEVIPEEDEEEVIEEELENQEDNVEPEPEQIPENIQRE
ncbi:hypothetical protein HDV06_003108 [Boothiomyces sp. JEL0866]|nr:hypothetical protein HDV06_003108 [Boothiomyces sp. JEL0866]